MEVRCDGCGCAFALEVQNEQDREMEKLFFTCPFCGRKYLVSVTDANLRKDIHAYREMAEMNRQGRLSEEDQYRMQAMKAANVSRQQELKAGGMQ